MPTASQQSVHSHQNVRASSSSTSTSWNGVYFSVSLMRCYIELPKKPSFFVLFPVQRLFFFSFFREWKESVGSFVMRTTRGERKEGGSDCDFVWPQDGREIALAGQRAYPRTLSIQKTSHSLLLGDNHLLDFGHGEKREGRVGGERIALSLSSIEWRDIEPLVLHDFLAATSLGLDPGRKGNHGCY